MKNEFMNNLEILKQQAAELHDLTVDMCEMCEGTYEENLDGAESYFNLNGERFKMIIKKV